MAQDRPDYSSNIRFIDQDIDVTLTREWYSEKGLLRTWVFWEVLTAGGSVERELFTVPEGKFLLLGDVQYASRFLGFFSWRAFPPITISQAYLTRETSYAVTLTIPIMLEAGRTLFQYAENFDTISAYYYMQLTVIAPLGFSKKREEAKDALEYYYQGDWNHCEVTPQAPEISLVRLSKVLDPVHLELRVRRFGQPGEEFLDVVEHKRPPAPVF